MAENPGNELQQLLEQNNLAVMSSMRNFLQAEFKKIKEAQETSVTDHFARLKDSQEQGMIQQQAQLQEIRASVQKFLSFKKKGNEDKFRQNAQVLQFMRDSHSSLGNDAEENPAKTSASEKLAEGMSFIEHRQKLIKLADSWEAGWSLVAEYEANLLAEDSDDERRISKAQLRPERKMKEVRKKREEERRRQSYLPRPQPPVTAPSSYSQLSTSREWSYTKIDRCFGCGDKGHWKSDCPREREHKISIKSIVSSETLIKTTVKDRLKNNKVLGTNY